MNLNSLSNLVKLLIPVVIMALTWLFVILLFSLRLSSLLGESIASAWLFYVISIVPFLFGYVIMFLFRKSVSTEVAIFSEISPVYYKRFFTYFYFWLVLTILEIIYSGGFPFLWLLTGSSKIYFDYGIPSVHGLLNALELALSIIAFYIYKVSKRKQFLWITIFFVIWNILLVTRQVIIVSLIEIMVVFYLMSSNKMLLIKRMVIYVVLGVIGFGILGDFRSGGEAFVKLASPTDNWPLWLPSGFLWVYIYITTPLNNLLFNFTFPVYNTHIFFPNTLSLLLPSVLRNIIFDPATYTVNGNLVTEAFNVSSAFSAPYTDMGLSGIIIFSFFIGVFSNLIWWVTGIKRIFFHAILIQIIVLSIFYNMFMYLPVVFQFVWISIYFSKSKKSDLSTI
jgi:oligosaccharide repeat unit polymerase